MRTLLLPILLLILSPPLCGQEQQDIQLKDTAEVMKEKQNKGLINWVTHLLTDLDTTYVHPNKYKYALMLENSNWYEYYHFKTIEESPQRLLFAPKMNYKLGGYFGWKWIFIGYSIDLRDLFNKRKDQDQRTEFGLSLYSSVAGCDVYYRKSGNAFKLRNMKDFMPEGHTGSIDKDVRGLSTDIKGLNAYWIFNHRKFSYPAAYSQSTNQRRSAGSLIAGFSISDHNINFKRHKLPDHVLEQLSEAYNFQRINYTDFSLSLGYSYNWVFAKNCLANLSLTPAIAYKHSKIDAEQAFYPAIDHFNVDFITRAGITYNNTKYFVGASLIMHTYEYHTDHFNLSNSFGTIRIYAGFNFIKKKKKE